MIIKTYFDAKDIHRLNFIKYTLKSFIHDMNNIVTNNKISLKEKLFIYFSVLHNIRFFNYAPYVHLERYLILIDVLLNIYYFYICITNYTDLRRSKAILVFSSMYMVFVLSIFVSLFVNGQSLYYGLTGLSPQYLSIGLFYYLYARKIPVDCVKKMLWILAGSYILVTILSYIQYPNNIFGYNEIAENRGDTEQLMDRSMQDRGVYRFLITGCDYITLGLFYLVTIKNKIKFKGALICICVLFTLMRGARSPIMLTILISILAFLVANKFSIVKIIALMIGSVLLYVGAINIPFTEKMIDSMSNYTKDEINETGKDNVRLLALEYYTLEYNENQVVPIVIGNGPTVVGPHFDKVKKAMAFGLYDCDIEYLRLFIYFGLIGIIIILFWGVSFICMSVPPDYLYLKFFILYLLGVMCLGSHFSMESPMIALVCYMICVGHQRKINYG